MKNAFLGAVSLREKGMPQVKIRRGVVWLCLFVGNVALAQIPEPVDAPMARTPEETAASYRLPPGFRLEVVASEPLIASPSGVCWDEQGRMFVSELHGYNLEGQLDIEELNKTGKLDTQVRRVQADEKFKQAAEAGTYGAVKMLLDTNGDGRMDKAVTWSTNLPPAYGLVPARGGVIVACAPDIVFLADRDGDGVAEVQEKLFAGFRTGALERGINAPQWGSDGWIYFGRGWGGGRISGPRLKEAVELPGSDFRIRPDGSAIEPVTGNTHTFGFAITEAADRFTVTTTVPGIYIAPLPWRYLTRNANALTPALEAPARERRAYSISKPHPWRQKRAEHREYFEYYKSRYGAAESEPDGWFTAACGPMIYRDKVLPGLHGQYFVCEPSGNLIHRAIVLEEGPGLTLRRAPGEEKSEFAASTDQWSHPMNLTHGPDGSIWITDYYREIIEDYSAIPRHLQQQYGVYKGHDRGRIYRLTHEKASRPPLADMSRLEIPSLVQECASPLLWRRQTAQRLLAERGGVRGVPLLRTLLRGELSPEAIVAVLRTLDQLNGLEAAELERFVMHAEPAVRIHALQLADQRFEQGGGAELFAAVLQAAERETNARVQIQFALSLGGARASEAFPRLIRFAREQSELRWMGAAILSSVNGREVDVLSELLRMPGRSERFIPQLAQTIGARRNEIDLERTVKLLGYAPSQTHAAVLDGLSRGRKNAQPMSVKGSARSALAQMTASPIEDVSRAARALEQTFAKRANEDEPSSSRGSEEMSEETFRRFVGALSGARDLKRGHEVFSQACATCHRIGDEGTEVGPDLVGQLGVNEETLLKDILMPSERIRPGYESTEVQLRDGTVIIGLLRDDAATSLRLMQANGAEQQVLRKDVTDLRRVPMSLMPLFAEAISPDDMAHLLGWLRSQLRPDREKTP